MDCANPIGRRPVAARLRNRFGSCEIQGHTKGDAGMNTSRRAPAYGAGALPKFSALPAAPAVDDARFDSGIILPGPAKVGVQIIDLD